MAFSLDDAIEWMNAMKNDAHQMMVRHGESLCESDRRFLEEKESLSEICLIALEFMKHSKEEII